MLVKEVVHKTIAQLYYMLLHLLKRFPTPDEAMGRAQNMVSSVNTTAHDAVAKGGEMVSSVYDKAVEEVSEVVDGVQRISREC